MPYLGLETIRRGNTAACVEDIFTIHFPTAKRVLDCTAGAMRFWKWDPLATLGHQLDITAIDIDPSDSVKDDPRVRQGNYLELPFEEGQFDVMTFDPMFIFSRGISAVNGTARLFMGAEAANYDGRTWQKQIIEKPKNPTDLLGHYRRIFEQRKIATQGLICKGQDLVVSKDVDWWSFNVFNLGKEMGLGEPTDILIQHSPAHRMRDPRWKNQYKFRRAHCFYIVYKFPQTVPKVAVPDVPCVD